MLENTKKTLYIQTVKQRHRKKIYIWHKKHLTYTFHFCFLS